MNNSTDRDLKGKLRLTCNPSPCSNRYHTRRICIVQEYYYDESEDDLDEVSKRPVPILLSILLVVAYIVGGAFLFQMWEGWSFLDRYIKT